MDSTIATETETVTPDTAQVTPETSQPAVDTAVVGTTEVTPPGEANGSSTSQTSSAPTETAEGRLTKQLEARFSNPATAQPAQVPAVQPNQAQQPLTLQAVQEALGLKSPDDLKRLQNQSVLFGRQANELGTLRKQFQELTQAQQAEQQRREQEAARQNLSPFHAKHPNKPETDARISRARAFTASLNAAPPELQKDPAYRANLARAHGGVTQDDLNLEQQATQYRDQQLAEQAADPAGFVEKYAEQAFNRLIQRYDEYQSNRQQAQSFVAQNQELISNPATQQLMANVLDPATSRSDLAVQIAKLTQERDALLAKAHQVTGETEQLKAQQEMSGRQVFPTRRASTSTTTHVDPWKSYDPKDPKAREKLLDGLLKR